MNGIELKSGVNDCYWNISGKCTNQIITRNKLPLDFLSDLSSTQSCTYTQIGVGLCSCYYQQSSAEGCRSGHMLKTAMV